MKRHNAGLRIIQAEHKRLSGLLQKGCDRELAKPDMPKMDCKRGCSSCCTMPVAALVAEAVVMVAGADEGTLTVVEERLSDEVAACNAPGMDNITWMERQSPCVWLRDRECMAYERRPFTCRGYYAVDRELCGQPKAMHTCFKPAKPIGRAHYDLLKASQMAFPSLSGMGPLPVATHVALTLRRSGVTEARREARTLGVDAVTEATFKRWRNLA